MAMKWEKVFRTVFENFLQVFVESDSGSNQLILKYRLTWFELSEGK